MEISKRFRQDLVYYMLGVIVPGIINALTVPLLKKLLGSASFGKYGIQYNFLLLLVAFSVGWLCQSIIRFKFSAEGEEHFFYRQVFKIGGIVTFGIGIISLFLNLSYYHNGLFFSLLFSSGFILCGFQNILIAISQANFLARFTMYSEAIRTIVFFVSAMVLLQIEVMPAIDALFLSLNFSYLVSSFLLFRKNKLPELLSAKGVEIAKSNVNLRHIFSYGIPLAVWYLITYLMLFIDKPLLAQQSGYEVQGNYQALFEIINKGAVVLLLPVSYALFPLLANAYENNDDDTGLRFLKKIIYIEFGLMITGLLAYWWFGFYFLQYLLSVPNNLDYKLSGLFMLASTFIWQIGMLVHKPYELRKKTNILLWKILGALFVYLIILFYVNANPTMEAYRFTLPFLGASVTYVLSFLFKSGLPKNLGVDMRELKGMIKKKLTP